MSYKLTKRIEKAGGEKEFKSENYIKKMKEEQLEGELIKKQVEEELEREKLRDIERRKRAAANREEF